MFKHFHIWFPGLHLPIDSDSPNALSGMEGIGRKGWANGIISNNAMPSLRHAQHRYEALK
jgi:hypothetical protein